MGIIDRVKAATTALVRGDALREPIGFSPKLSSEAGERVNEESVLGLSAVWACTNLISGTIGSLPLQVHKQGAGVSELDLENPLFRVLNFSPNYDQTALDFWEFMAASLELWGNAYAEIVRTGSFVVGLSPINPDTMKVERIDTGAIQYTWKQGDVEREEIDENILHIRGFGGAPLGGLSTLHFARNSFGIARAVDRAAGSTFRNGLRPSGALTFEDFLSPDNRKIAEEKLVEKYVGAVNAGRPLVLEGGTKWQQLTINPEDAQMLESRRFSVEEICRFFGVPPHMVGHTENSTSWGAGLEQQTLGFQKFTLRRRLKRIEMSLEKQLLTPEQKVSGISIKFNVEGLLRGDSAGRSAYYTAMTNIGAMTINEIRALENLPPVEGGEVPRMQMQNVPITEAGNDSNV